MAYLRPDDENPWYVFETRIGGDVAPVLCIMDELHDAYFFTLAQITEGLASGQLELRRRVSINDEQETELRDALRSWLRDLERDRLESGSD